MMRLMALQKSQIPVFIFTLVAVALFTANFLVNQNYEFMVYIAVIVAIGALIYFTNDRVKYPNFILWGLSLWALIHMSGGAVYVGETRLYEVVLIPIWEEVQFFRYDHFAHMFGFGVTTLVMFHILKPHLKKLTHWTAVSIVVVMAGLGAGAFYELIEFGTTLVVEEQGVGGYVNNMMDLFSNFVGAVLAMIYTYRKEVV